MQQQLVDINTQLCPETCPCVVELLEGLVRWLHLNWYKGRRHVLDIQKEIWSAVHEVIWSMATVTDAIKSEKMPVGDQDAMRMPPKCRDIRKRPSTR
mmetsp:Transcript_118954/g.207182  ORF Transcript_118954/g.207182 Transcript_118954/m.207182 type:complete len:97 (-) Transcript_118954:91-381(-)